MLNQAASDREKLAHLLNISNEQMSYHLMQMQAAA